MSDMDIGAILDDAIDSAVRQFHASLKQAYQAAEMADVGLVIKQPRLEHVSGDVVAFTWGFEVDRTKGRGYMEVRE